MVYQQIYNTQGFFQAFIQSEHQGIDVGEWYEGDVIDRIHLIRR